MTAQIYLLASAASTRIVLTAALSATGYRVTAVSDMREFERRDGFAKADLVIAGGMWEQLCAARDLCCPDLPVLAVLVENDAPEARMTALTHGVQDVVSLSRQGVLLLARTRALLRRRAEQKQLRLNDATSAALGFAEDGQAPLRPPGRIALVTAASDARDRLSDKLRHLTRAEVVITAPSVLRDARGVVPKADVAILDARSGAEADHGHDPLLRLISDLRSRSDSRDMMQLVLFDPRDENRAALALDLGADDVVAANASDSEIAHRAGRLLRRKTISDSFKDRVLTGLQAAVTDALTGLHNRRFALAQMTRLCAADGPLAIMILDLDRFKTINDTHGHGAGDDVLIGFADRLRDSLRGEDLVARLGGEEFLIALPGTTRQDALTMANRLLDIIAAKPFFSAHVDGPLQVTASVGLCIRSGRTEPPEQLLQRADRALLEAKRAGRNQAQMSV